MWWMYNRNRKWWGKRRWRGCDVTATVGYSFNLYNGDRLFHLGWIGMSLCYKFSVPGRNSIKCFACVPISHWSVNYRRPGIFHTSQPVCALCQHPCYLLLNWTQFYLIIFARLHGHVYVCARALFSVIAIILRALHVIENHSRAN